ncbi:MAG: glucodextranase DOMON-like domain-containing protein, partial [Elusimicrobiota bacterium]
LYGQTVSALTAYQNSGNASLAVLDKATQALYEAQSFRFFRKDGPEADRGITRGNAASDAVGAAERDGAEFRARLRKVYQTLRQPVPDELRGNPRSPSPGGTEDPSGKAGSEKDSGSVEGGLEGNLLWFSNPEDSTAYRPAGEAGQAASADAWTFRSMSVSWDEKEITFFFILKALEASKSTRFGFDRLMVDLYVDINHRPGQGSIDLLEGREGFVPQADAWEYALVASPSGAWLLRFVPGQGPVAVDAPRIEADIPNGELRVAVPRSKLRGNPAAWGYLPLALSPQAEPQQRTESAGKTPPTPVLGEHGGSILGVIAPGRTGKNTGAAASRRRFPFLRIQRRPR